MDRNTTIYSSFKLMSVITMKMRKNVESVLKTMDLTYPQFGALSALKNNSGITQKDLALNLETDTTTTMVICDSLEKKKFIKRVADKSDRRVNRLEITDAGVKILDSALPAVMKLYTPLMSSIPNEEWEVLESSMRKIHDSVDSLTSSQKD